MRDFLLSNEDVETGFHCVKWGDVCHSNQKGGLGIRPLCDINKALKAKWLWRFAEEDNTLWENMVNVNYDVDRLGWWSRKSSHAYGVGCWKSIISVFDDFKSLVNFEVKNGFRVLFWHDVWCGDQPLKDQFPDLFRMARFKDATMQQVVSWHGGGWGMELRMVVGT